MNIEVRHHHHYQGDGIGGGIWTLALLLLLLPPLLPLIALEYYSRVFMTAHHWHPVFKGTVALAELRGLCTDDLLRARIGEDGRLDFRGLMGTMYGGFAALDVTSDKIWITATVLVSWAIGYGLGTAGSRSARQEDVRGTRG